MHNIPNIPVDWTPYLERANRPFSLSIVIVYNDMHAALRAAEDETGAVFNAFEVVG